MALGSSRIVSVISDTEPVTLAEAKTYLTIVNDTDHDSLITSQISAARQIAEGYLSRDILPRERQQFIKNITDIYQTLYSGPIDTVTSIISNGVTLNDPGDYEVVGLTNEPYVKFSDTRFIDVTIEYSTLGLQDNETIKQGILAIVSDLYNGVDIKKSCFAIMAPLKKMYI